jgi:hypothetical protein
LKASRANTRTRPSSRCRRSRAYHHTWKRERIKHVAIDPTTLKSVPMPEGSGRKRSTSH